MKIVKENALILVETTVPPGTCLKVVKPIIYEELRKRKLDTSKIRIGHSYERVMQVPIILIQLKIFIEFILESIKNQLIKQKIFKIYYFTKKISTN